MACADVLVDYEEDVGSFAINKKNWSKHNMPKSKLMESKYSNRIFLGDIRDNSGNRLKMSQSMRRNIDRTEHNAHENRNIRRKDKKDRATTEMVLDHRTKCILYGMLSKGLVEHIYGSISMGKEANVYYCTDEEEKQFALKIYKTSILSFRDRARYIRGEHRFERGFCKNPRKMVQLWAEKEFRNLHRLYNAHIPCPRPLYVRQNVLLMNIIGEDGVAAPRLKDINFEDEVDDALDDDAREDAVDDLLYDCYLQIIKYTRLMYWKCNLVHGDLSEYNILYQDGIAYFIDVSQSVEPAHPNSYQFLAVKWCTQKVMISYLWWNLFSEWISSLFSVSANHQNFECVSSVIFCCILSKNKNGQNVSVTSCLVSDSHDIS